MALSVFSLSVAYLTHGRFIDFVSSTPEQLDQLAAACHPATFGRGNQDAYGESYRKAPKMDTADFAAQFDPTMSGLIRTIEENLLRGETEKMSIRSEIYKLNVYSDVLSPAPPPYFSAFPRLTGKDSFFVAHKDTPRGTAMLGSLVVFYPTPHQGGELVLRHKGRKWIFDANAFTSFPPSPSIAYVAFYRDIEHEVLKVTAGSRVTLTYNLYLAHSLASRAPVLSSLSTAFVKPNLKDATNFQATLCRLLKSPEFMPEGGTLAFNFAHLYPITFDTKLQEMTAYLKGRTHMCTNRVGSWNSNPSCG